MGGVGIGFTTLSSFSLVSQWRLSDLDGMVPYRFRSSMIQTMLFRPLLKLFRPLFKKHVCLNSKNKKQCSTFKITGP